MALFKHFIRSLLPLGALILISCDNSRGIRKDHIELDPEVEAKVKAINLERYGGSWLTQGAKGNFYLEINEDGYYSLQEDESRMPIRGDQGSIAHYKPGLMILTSDRDECKDPDHITYLRMDRIGENARVVHHSQGHTILELVSVNRNEHTTLDDLACIE